MKIRITKGDAWYEDLVGHTFYVDSEDVNSDVGHIYYVDPEWMYYVDPEWMAEVEGRRFVSAEDCVVVDEFGEVDEWEGEAVREVGNNSDPVNPSHYKQGRTEVIDIIEDAVQGAEGIEAVCQANILKYILRYRHKNGVEDVKKAIWYAERLAKVLEEDE